MVPAPGTRPYGHEVDQYAGDQPAIMRTLQIGPYLAQIQPFQGQVDKYRADCQPDDEQGNAPPIIHSLPHSILPDRSYRVRRGGQIVPCPSGFTRAGAINLNAA